ncbi:MAG: hypothetical protein K6B74_04045 [Ruminococcus sp.]|nr:hypothetical protein [Ruminococcus sp.]
MKNLALCVVGLSVYVIVTIVDYLFVSLPLYMYVGGLVIGSLLILLFFLGNSGSQKKPKQKKIVRTIPAAHRIRHTVYHLSRQPIMR